MNEYCCCGHKHGTNEDCELCGLIFANTLLKANLSNARRCLRVLVEAVEKSGDWNAGTRVEAAISDAEETLEQIAEDFTGSR